MKILGLVSCHYPMSQFLMINLSLSSLIGSVYLENPNYNTIGIASHYRKGSSALCCSSKLNVGWGSSTTLYILESIKPSQPWKAVCPRRPLAKVARGGISCIAPLWLAWKKTQSLSFMKETLKKLGIDESYLNIIKAIYAKLTNNIIFSGKRLKALPLRSETN